MWKIIFSHFQSILLFNVYLPFNVQNKHLFKVGQETCYNVPRLEPSSVKVEITLPEPVQRCQKRYQKTSSQVFNLFKFAKASKIVLCIIISSFFKLLVTLPAYYVIFFTMM